MGILNLTRKIIPAVSKLSRQNRQNVMEMPEMILSSMIRNGDKKIIQVGMNECKAARILPERIHTIYTDGLAGCNSIGIISKGKDGNPIAILSHYTPLPVSQTAQANAIEKQLKTYGAFFDKKTTPKVFYNVPGYLDEEQQLKPCVNNVFEKIHAVLNKFFNNNYDEQIILYQNRNRPAYFSSANIFQFDPKDLSKCKMTTVGEKEFFFDV